MVHRPDAPSECPACHSARVARIRYRLPHFTPELGKELGEGRAVWGDAASLETTRSGTARRAGTDGGTALGPVH
jgi:hypothetical protein